MNNALLNASLEAKNAATGVAFYIGAKPIFWYGIIIAVGLIAGVFVGLMEAKRRGYRSELVLDFILIAVPICILCARLYYVIFEWNNMDYAANPLHIFYVWEGGLAIYGGVIGGAIAALIFYKWRRISVGEMMDIAAPGLIIGQAIGRWGNFTNQEAFGNLVTNPLMQWFPYSVYIENAKTIDGITYAPGFYQATFFYESMWNLIVFAVLMLLRKKIKVRGGLFALYVTLYGFGRFWIEQLRTDSLMMGNMRVSQGLSELLFFGGIAYLVYMYFTKREYAPYSGYYSLGLTEEQVEGLKGKNSLLNAKLELSKAKWLSEIMHKGSMTSPRYRAIKEKAALWNEKADKLREELGEENPKAAAALKKAEALTAKADKINAKGNLTAQLDVAQQEADKARERYESLKNTDADSTEALEAQEKAETAALLVEKIKDNLEEEQKSREAWFEKAELNIEMLEDRVRIEEERAKEAEAQKMKKKSKPEKDEPSNPDEEYEVESGKDGEDTESEKDDKKDEK
jgi:phosphatidylglycerol:prolipoprotein diacylglycerol transferase